MHMPKTADLGTQALSVVHSFKLHLNAFNNCIAKMEVGCMKYQTANVLPQSTARSAILRRIDVSLTILAKTLGHILDVQFSEASSPISD